MNNLHKKSFLFFSILFLISIMNSCIIVKKKVVEEEKIVNVDLIQKPEILMNEEVVRSAKGDMISMIPRGWFFVDLGADTPPDVFLVATNPEYSLTLVFSSIPQNTITSDIYKAQKSIGLANYLFDKKQMKSAGSLIKNKTITNFKSGNLEFAVYKYRTKQQPMNAMNAVFSSSADMIYEVSLIPMNLTGLTMPSEFEMEKIFTSVLSTIRY